MKIYATGSSDTISDIVSTAEEGSNVELTFDEPPVTEREAHIQGGSIADRSQRGVPNNNNNTKAVRTRCSRITAVALGLVVLATLSLGVFFFLDKQGIFSSSSVATTSQDFQGTVSVSELATHMDTDDCWMALHGNVYDLTNYAPSHPGGPDYIWDYCGTDATGPYDREHSSGLLSTVSGALLGSYVTDDFQPVASNSVTGQTTNYDDNSSPSSSSDDPGDDIAPVPAPVSMQQASAPTSTKVDAPLCISETDVFSHASRDDCWYILYGSVYDLTDYIDRHPGPARSVWLQCGTDATVAYSAEKKHDASLLQKENMDRYLLGQSC